MVIQEIKDAEQGCLIRQFSLKGENQYLAIRQGMIHPHSVQNLDPLIAQCSENAYAVGCRRRYVRGFLLDIFHKIKCIQGRAARKKLLVAVKEYKGRILVVRWRTPLIIRQISLGSQSTSWERIPNERATLTADVRASTWSLAKICWMCFFTVRSEINNSLPISLLV